MTTTWEDAISDEVAGVGVDWTWGSLLADDGEASSLNTVVVDDGSTAGVSSDFDLGDSTACFDEVDTWISTLLGVM